MFQIQSVCFNSSPKQLLLASSAVDPTQTGNYNRNFTAFLQTHRHRNDKPPFNTSLVVTLKVSVKILYRAVSEFEGKKKKLLQKAGRRFERDDVVSHHM